MPLRLAILLCAAGLIATVLFFRTGGTGMTPMPAVADVARLAGTWQLDRLDGAAIEAGPLLMAEPDGALRGETGCNRFGGSWEAVGDTLLVGPLAMTKRACIDPDANALERAYVEALEATVGYALDGGRLELRGADGAVLAGFAAIVRSGPVTFLCDDSSEIVAVFLQSDPPFAELTREEGGALAVRNTLTRTGSGARFVGDGVDFWNQGREAQVDWRGERLVCEER